MSPHTRTKSCGFRTARSRYPRQTSQTLDRMPNRLITCHCQPRSDSSSRKKTATQQSPKLKVTSIVSDPKKKKKHLSAGSLGCCQLSRDLASPVAKWILRTVHPSAPRKKNERGTLKSSVTGCHQGCVLRIEGSPTWSPLRLRMLDSSISPSAFSFSLSEPFTTV